MSFMGGTYRRIELDPPHDRVSVFVEVRDIPHDPQTPPNREEQKNVRGSQLLYELLVVVGYTGFALSSPMW